MKVGVKARVADWFIRWQPYMSLAFLALMSVSYPLSAFGMLAITHWSALNALRKPSGAKPIESAPCGKLDPVGEELCRMIDAVQFEKAMVGQGFNAVHSVTVKQSGKPDVYVLVSSQRVTAKEYL